MKKFILFFVIAASFFTGCKKDFDPVIPPPDPAPPSLIASKFAYGSASGVSSLREVVKDTTRISPADTVSSPVIEQRANPGTVE